MGLDAEAFSTVQEFLTLDTFGDESGAGGDLVLCGIVDAMAQLEAEDAVLKAAAAIVARARTA